MSCFSKFREVFQNYLHGKQDQPQSATTATHNPTSEDPAQEHPYDALSKVTAPPPVERFQHDAISVDSGSDSSIGEDPYRALSEVSVEPPVKRIQHDDANAVESDSDRSIGEDPYRALSEVSVEPPVKRIHKSTDTLEQYLRQAFE